MGNKAIIAVLLVSVSTVSFLSGMQAVEVVKANPSWGTPATPIPPITDPPQIIITSPSSEEYSNPVPLNITIIQPDSWVSKYNMTLPKPWVDTSDDVVVGQNTLRSITCIIDGQSVTLWNGTYFGFGVTYYLPRVTQFSALMSVSKGQHNLQVNVSAISEYAVDGIIPFAERTYNITASQTTQFNTNNDSGLLSPPTLYDIKSSYEIRQPYSDSTTSTPTSDSSMQAPSPTPSLTPSTPSPPPTPPPTLTISPTPTPKPTESPTTSTNPPTSSPSAPEFPAWILLPLILATTLIIAYKRKGTKR